MRNTAPFLVLLVLLQSLTLYPLAITPPAKAQGSTDYPWAMFHHDSTRSGVTLASAPATSQLSWSHDMGAMVYSSPAIANGAVYIATYDWAANTGSLYSIDEYSGTVNWVFPTNGQIYASPAVSNGLVYITSKNSYIYAVNADTGQEVWKVQNISPLTSSPVVANGKVFYGTWKVSFWAELVALDALTGTPVWRNQTDDTIISSPSIHNGRVFFGHNSGMVIALNETSGRGIWRTAPNGSPVVITTTPAIAQGRVLVGTDNTFAALDEITGVTLWRFDTGGKNATSGAVYNGVVYFGTGAGEVHAVDILTGVAVWNYTVGSVVSSSPAIALGSGTLVFGAHDGYVYALDLSTGSLLWRYLTGGPVSSSPAVADGRVFVGSQDHRVYALGPLASSLQVTLSAGFSTLKSGEISGLTVTVRNGTVPVTAATILFTSSAGGMFATAAEQSPGVYLSNFTAPTVSAEGSATIRATARKSGYFDGAATVMIMVVPLPLLSVSLALSPSSVRPGGDILLMIRVSNGSEPLAGATILLRSSGSGSFSPPADLANGNYTAVYTAELQNASPTLVVNATVPGFASATAQATATVSGLPDLTMIKLYGIPVLMLLVGLFVLFMVTMVLIIVARRNRGAFDAPYSPRYAVGLWNPGRLI